MRMFTSALQAAFERALVTPYGDDNFDSIQASLSRVDVRQVRAQHPGCIRAVQHASSLPHIPFVTPATQHLLGPEQCRL